MSVRTWNRKQSKMEYVSNAMELLKFTTQKCLKVPKRLTFFISTDLVKTSQEIYCWVIYISTLYSTSNEHSAKRLDLIERCIAKLTYLSSILNILYVYCENKITDKQFEMWANIIEKEIALLKGLK